MHEALKRWRIPAIAAGSVALSMTLYRPSELPVCRQSQVPEINAARLIRDAESRPGNLMAGRHQTIGEIAEQAAYCSPEERSMALAIVKDSKDIQDRRLRAALDGLGSQRQILED